MNAGVTASDGSFIFCPLTNGNYDVVADAVTTSTLSTTVYGVTIAFQVPVGTALNNVPLVSEGSSTLSASPSATIAGQVTSAGSGGATVADITLSALQQATPTGGSPVLVTVPVFSAISEPPTVTTGAASSCPSGTDCFSYSLMVPPGNPQVGTFSSGSITYTPPASGTVTYSLNAVSEDCTASAPSPATVSSITVSPATTTQVSTVLAFSGCSAPM